MNKCIYFVEGPCEEQLINALKQPTPRLKAGKVKVFNVIQNLIPKSTLFSLESGMTVILAFDTDVGKTATIKENIERLKRFCSRVKIVFLPQVLTLEDELERATDVRKVTELTNSRSIKDFKSDFCSLKSMDCRLILEKHALDVKRLWESKIPDKFSFVTSNAHLIKVL